MERGLPLPPVPILSALLGFLFLMCGGWLQVAPVIAALSWESTTGVITHSEVDHYGDEIEIEVEYEYVVDGTSHEASRIHCSETPTTWADKSGAIFYGMGGMCSGKGMLSPYTLVAEYPKGAAVTVYFDPQHPEVAALETGVCRLGIVGFNFAVVCFGVAFAVPLFNRWRSRQADTNVPSYPFQ